MGVDPRRARDVKVQEWTQLASISLCAQSTASASLVSPQVMGQSIVSQAVVACANGHQCSPTNRYDMPLYSVLAGPQLEDGVWFGADILRTGEDLMESDREDKGA